MPIKALKKLPVAARNMWESVYKKLIKEGKSEASAAKIAWGVVKKHYKSVNTTKSVALQQTHAIDDSGNYIDILLGYPTLDAHGEILDKSFWAQSPMKPLIGDMEHINFQKAEGLRVDYPEMWDGFAPIADKYYHKGDELWAKVELPNHPFTPTFKQDWESGKYGVSIEYSYPEEAITYQWIDGQLVPTIISGEITGFTFTENPAIDTKINKKNE